MSEENNQFMDTLSQAFDKIIESNFGDCVAPEPVLTPTGIRHVDALLGGGIVSSGPVLFSSTPETGKSTIAFQFSSIFHQKYQNGIIVYLDIEGSGNLSSSGEFRMSRVETFGLNTPRFKHEPVVMTIPQVFELIDQLVDVKKKFEDKTNQEFYVCIIWDSIPATPGTKTYEVNDPERMIGHKARQLSFCLEKYISTMKFNRITFIAIDQIRANISVEGPYAQKESSVGEFKNFKAATNIFSLQHNIQQWLFFSKKKQITQADGMSINGWYIDVKTEKNKIASSRYEVRCVFDTHMGIDRFWSEYTFLNELTPTETKIYKTKKPDFELMMKKSGNRVFLEVNNPYDSSIYYKSDPFFRKDAKEKYKNDEEFCQWFDYAVALSVYIRITNGFMKLTDDQKKAYDIDPSGPSTQSDEVEEVIENTQEEVDPSINEDNSVQQIDDDLVDTNTGEIIDKNESDKDNTDGTYQSVLE